MHYFTITEYAAKFNVSRPTVYKRIDAGILHTLPTDGGKSIILVEDTEYEKVKA